MKNLVWNELFWPEIVFIRFNLVGYVNHNSALKKT